MANNPYKNKVVYDGTTLIDLTDDDVTAADVLEGKKFHLPSGAPAVGTRPEGSTLIVDTQDSHGGIIRNISSITDDISLTSKTVTPNDDTQLVLADDYVCKLEDYSSVASHTSGTGISSNMVLPTGVTLVDNQEYRLVGRVNVTDSSSQILEYYDVDVVVIWDAYSHTIVQNDSDAYYSLLTFKKASSKYYAITQKFGKTGTYGFKHDLSLYEKTAYDGLSSVTVNPIPNSYYSPTLMKNFIERSSSFTSFTFPDGITNIGSYAFSYCTYLKLTSLPNTITSIQSYAFNSCYVLALTSLPSGLTRIYDYSFRGCSKLALTSLPSGVTIIDQYAFYGCTSMSLSSLPSGLTTIGNYAFSGCRTAITISSLPDTVTSIGNGAFQYCTGITQISCNGTITRLGSAAFTGNSSYPMQLTSARFPYMALTSIISTVFGSGTAENACQLLEICDIGVTTGIATTAFANCYKLQTLILRKTSVCTLAGTSAFNNTPLSGYNGLTADVYVPNDLISSYQSASNWSTLYAGGYITFKKIEGSIYELS